MQTPSNTCRQILIVAFSLRQRIERSLDNSTNKRWPLKNHKISLACRGGALMGLLSLLLAAPVAYAYPLGVGADSNAYGGGALLQQHMCR